MRCRRAAQRNGARAVRAEICRNPPIQLSATVRAMGARKARAASVPSAFTHVLRVQNSAPCTAGVHCFERAR